MIINKILELSVYHIKPKTMEWLDGESISTELSCITTWPHTYGWIINIFEPPNQYDDIPYELNKIIYYCLKEHITWIYIDKDIPICDEFENFEREHL